MYLYESHVWQVMITYGGIILSFIKMVGAAQRPEGRQYVCMCFLCVCTHAWISAGLCMCERARMASPHQKVHLEVIWSFFPKVGREGGKRVQGEQGER